MLICLSLILLLITPLCLLPSVLIFCAAYFKLTSQIAGTGVPQGSELGPPDHLKLKLMKLSIYSMHFFSSLSPLLLSTGETEHVKGLSSGR